MRTYTDIMYVHNVSDICPLLNPARTASTPAMRGWSTRRRSRSRLGWQVCRRGVRENGNHVGRNQVGRSTRTGCRGMLVQVHGLHHEENTAVFSDGESRGLAHLALGHDNNNNNNNNNNNDNNKHNNNMNNDTNNNNNTADNKYKLLYRV